MSDTMPLRLVPETVIKSAWVAAVSALNHDEGTCNPGLDARCFVCEALEALRPYHHGDAGRIERHHDSFCSFAAEEAPCDCPYRAMDLRAGERS